MKKNFPLYFTTLKQKQVSGNSSIQKISILFLFIVGSLLFTVNRLNAQSINCSTPTEEDGNPDPIAQGESLYFKIPTGSENLIQQIIDAEFTSDTLDQPIRELTFSLREEGCTSSSSIVTDDVFAPPVDEPTSTYTQNYANINIPNFECGDFITLVVSNTGDVDFDAFTLTDYLKDVSLYLLF